MPTFRCASKSDSLCGEAWKPLGPSFSRGSGSILVRPPPDSATFLLQRLRRPALRWPWVEGIGVTSKQFVALHLADVVMMDKLNQERVCGVHAGPPGRSHWKPAAERDLGASPSTMPGNDHGGRRQDAQSVGDKLHTDCIQRAHPMHLHSAAPRGQLCS